MITSIKSPFLEYKMTILRNKKTSNSLFRQTMNEASYLIAAEVLKHLKYKKVTVQTPLTKTTGKDLAQQVILVPILRAGLGLLEGFVKFLPDAEKGHIGLYRDEQTYEPVEYLCKLPKTKNKKGIIHESADIIYHLLALWVATNVHPKDVWAELSKRKIKSGYEEKNSRDRNNV